ncbi:MAG: bacterial extracellular solute-binding protein [Halonotius sp. J07HN4]|nr:MAG: bacterial extracellular solute-binding protein [Halonotius sp. J07HN4]
MQFDSATSGQEATFRRFEPHFLWRDTEQITIEPGAATGSTAANRSQNATTADSDKQRPPNGTVDGMSANATNQSKTANASTDGVANVRFPKATVVDEPINSSTVPNDTGSNTTTTTFKNGSTQTVTGGSNVAADNSSSIPGNGSNVAVGNDSNVSVGNDSNTPVDNNSNIPVDAGSIPNGTAPRGDRPVTVDIDPAPLPEGYDDSPPFATLTVEVAPSDNTVVELLRTGAVDASRGPLGVDALDQIDTLTDGSVMASRSHAVYHLGYNTRSRPLRNPHFRRVIARLIDREAILASVFDDNGAPATDFLSAGHDESPWLPAELRWDGEHPELPFFESDGSLNVEAAKTAFRELGYAYSTDGELIDPQRSE